MDLTNYLDNVEESATEIWQAYEGGTEYEGKSGSDALDEWPLEIAVTRRMEIVLACGGPSARLYATISGSGDIHDVELRVRDGGTKGMRRVYEGDPLFDIARYFAGTAIEEE